MAVQDCGRKTAVVGKSWLSKTAVVQDCGPRLRRCERDDSGAARFAPMKVVPIQDRSDVATDRGVSIDPCASITIRVRKAANLVASAVLTGGASRVALAIGGIVRAIEAMQLACPRVAGFAAAHEVGHIALDGGVFAGGLCIELWRVAGRAVRCSRWNGCRCAVDPRLWGRQALDTHRAGAWAVGEHCSSVLGAAINIAGGGDARQDYAQRKDRDSHALHQVAYDATILRDGGGCMRGRV